MMSLPSQSPPHSGLSVGEMRTKQIVEAAWFSTVNAMLAELEVGGTNGALVAGGALGPRSPSCPSRSPGRRTSTPATQTTIATTTRAPIPAIHQPPGRPKEQRPTAEPRPPHRRRQAGLRDAEYCG